MEELIFKRRNRLKKHFVNVSNVLLYGYTGVSDAAKITYQVIDGFDWEDKETGDSKGYVFPATDTLAKIRNTTTRTIRRHVSELEQAGLLTRKRRSHKSSILIIEDVSEEEIAGYTEKFLDGKKSSPDGGGKPPQAKAKLPLSEENVESQKESTDKNVRSQDTQRTKMSAVYKKKENEGIKKKMKSNVNENFTIKKRNAKSSSIGEILKTYRMIQPKKQTKKPEKYAKRDYVAEEIASRLNDRKSLGCYRVIAEKVPDNVIFQTLASVEETRRAGKIRQSAGALFVSIMEKYGDSHGIDLGFKET